VRLRADYYTWDQAPVECYGDHKAVECPAAFNFQGRHRAIAEIIDRCHEGSIEAERPEVDYFRVRTIEDSIFLLRYLSLFSSW
jgi:hypothetical protein